MPRRRFLPCLLLLAALAPAQGQPPAAAPATPTQTPTQATARFANRNASFHIQLPAQWRQIAPGEARTVGERREAPPKLGFAQPNHFYAVGPVDQWLAGDFRGAWLYVVEQDAEWHIGDHWQDDLRAMWREEGAASGNRHELTNLRRAKVGTQGVEALLAERTTTPPDGRPVVRSLDVHAPCGGRQVSLSFCCPPERFGAEEPGFVAALATLTFARLPREQQDLGDRLWSPLLTGGAVALVLLLLYKHTRGRR
jgi:hypothetical protein